MIDPGLCCWVISAFVVLVYYVVKENYFSLYCFTVLSLIIYFV